jgi:hypothetical protein
MAKRPLKVFRTSTGFQDAYVAATSRKAALEAWGARTDLFASGMAELVTDAKLTKAPLAHPGVVIRSSRGTAAQHLAAAGKTKTKRTKASPSTQSEPVLAKPKKRLPRPSRAKLDRAEAALTKRHDEFAVALAKIDARMEDLRREREQLRAKRADDLAKLEDQRDREGEAYRSALEAWEG